MNEFAINWLKGGEYAEITVPSGSALKSKLLKYSQERPDEVSHVIINKDGSMVCRAPISYIHVAPPRKVSEKQRAAAKERFRKMWEEKKAAGESEEALLEEMMDEMEDDSMEDENEDA